MAGGIGLLAFDVGFLVGVWYASIGRPGRDQLDKLEREELKQRRDQDNGG